MKYVVTVAVAVMCGVLFLAGCSKKTPSAENPQASESQQSSPATTAAPVMTPATTPVPAEAPAAVPAAEVVALNETNFDSQIAQGVVLVDFWAAWCGPCKIQGPIVEQVAKQIGTAAKIAKLDVDAAAKVAQRFSIGGIPTLIVFKDGKPVQQFVGVTPAETLVAAIQAALKPQG